MLPLSKLWNRLKQNHIVIQYCNREGGGLLCKSVTFMKSVVSFLILNMFKALQNPPRRYIHMQIPSLLVGQTRSKFRLAPTPALNPTGTMLPYRFTPCYPVSKRPNHEFISWPACLAKSTKASMGELQYAQTSGATSILICKYLHW